MMNLKVNVIDTKAQAVTVTAIGRGYYGTEWFDVKHTVVQNYSDQFSLEELISDISIDTALEYQQKYGQKCWIDTIIIDEEV